MFLVDKCLNIILKLLVALLNCTKLLLSIKTIYICLYTANISCNVGTIRVCMVCVSRFNVIHIMWIIPVCRPAFETPNGKTVTKRTSVSPALKLPRDYNTTATTTTVVGDTGSCSGRVAVTAARDSRKPPAVAVSLMRRT